MNVWNGFVGYVLHLNLQPRLSDADAVRRRIEQSLRRKRRQGVVWGKEGRYFAPHAELLERLSSVCDLHATLSEDGGAGSGLPAAVRNHGRLSRSAWRELLAESAFLIGLGDPVSGPSALEALAEGCVYLDR